MLERLISGKNKFWFLIVLIIGSLAQIAIIFPSGLRSGSGIKFWGAQFHDGLWHIAIVNKFANFSFENPIFAGESLGNYHYFSDLIISLIHLITRINIFDLYFRFIPILISPSIGVLVFLLAKRLFKSEVTAIWSMFFTYLGSNLAFILPLFKLGYPIWETNFWVQQPMSIYSNMPFAISVPLVLLALYLLTEYLRSFNKLMFILSLIVLSITPATKSFTIFFFPAILLLGIYRIYNERKFDMLTYSISALVLAFLLMLPTLKLTRNFVYEPGWFLKTMIEAPDRMNWNDWGLRYQHYKYNNDFLNLIKFYAVAFIIFLIGNLGTRILAYVSIIRFKKIAYPEIHFELIFSAVLFATFPMFYLSSGISWNTIQLYYYFLLIAGIYSGYGIFIVLNYMKKRIYKYLFAIIIIFITIPVDVQTILFYYSRPTGSYITTQEVEAFNYLKNNGNVSDRVFTFPTNGSYVHLAAYTGKSAFLGDEVAAILTGHNYQKRLDEVNEIIGKRGEFVDYLKKNKIRWIYDPSGNTLGLLSNKIIQRYNKEGISIYEVIY